jgi:hypothetical protein
VVRGAWAFDPPDVFVPGSDLEGAVTALACTAAFETFWLAFWAAVDAAPLVFPPHALSDRLAIPIASAAPTDRVGRVELTHVGPDIRVRNARPGSLDSMVEG